jgi:Ca2+/Na+ antiporter
MRLSFAGVAGILAVGMRTANYIFSVISIVLGVALLLFMLTQTTGWNIGTAIGIVLVLNGVVRLWFAQDDH